MATTAIRVISVAGSPRRKCFRQPPPDIGLDFQFLDGATGLVDGARVDEMLCYKHTGRLMVAGEIGCYCSHLLAWRALLASEHLTQMIVMEDDVLADWLAVRQIAAVDWARHGITYLKLFWKYPARYSVKSWSYPIVDRHLVQFTSMAIGANAYLVTREAARSFAAAFSVISRPVDVQMDRPWATGIPVFGTVPVCAIEQVVETTIKHRDVVQRNIIPRWRYLRGRAIEHAWANAYRYTSLAPLARAKTLVGRSVALMSSR